jgi:hypothetical protein
MIVARRAVVCVTAAWVVLLALSDAPAYATHVPCGATITTDTTLDSDLTCPASGLTIDADGVTLELNGHTITGPRRNSNFHDTGVQQRS